MAASELFLDLGDLKKGAKPSSSPTLFHLASYNYKMIEGIELFPLFVSADFLFLNGCLYHEM